MLSSENKLLERVRSCPADLTSFSVLCLNSSSSRQSRLQARSAGLIIYQKTVGFFVMLLHKVQIMSQTDII